MARTRVLLIGAGAMANSVHYPSLASMEDVEMVALCDLAPEKLNPTAERFRIAKRYTNYREMLTTEEADAVYVLMPPHHLFDIVIAVLRSKRHVFIEKPPAITAFQTAAFVREAEKNGVLGMVGFNRRYIPMLTLARERVLRKGPLTQAVCTFYKHGSAVYYDGAVDVIGCDAIHAVDWLRFAAGPGAELDEAYSLPACYGDVVDNAWNAVMRFKNGMTGVLLTNWNTGARTHTFEMHAPGISAFLNPDETGRIIQDKEVEVLDTKQVGGAENFRYYGFFDENRHFIDSIQKKQLPSSCLQDALIESMSANGRPVRAGGAGKCVG
jgi:predicted dehydrogenase